MSFLCNLHLYNYVQLSSLGQLCGLGAPRNKECVVRRHRIAAMCLHRQISPVDFGQVGMCTINLWNHFAHKWCTPNDD